MDIAPVVGEARGLCLAHPGEQLQDEPGARAVGSSLGEYARGIAGGLLFSLPLLFTMELWWTGFVASPLRLIACLCGTFLLLLGYNRYAGMHQDANWRDVAVDSIEELGIGLALAALVLLLLGRLELGMSAIEIAGKTIVAAATVAIGVSVGTAQLGGARPDERGAGQSADEAEPRGLDERKPDFFGQLALATCGAVLVAGNVAPTEEIVMIAAEATHAHLFAMVGASVALAALVLFLSDFGGSRSHVIRRGPADVLAGLVLTYAVALGAAASMLAFFGRFDSDSPQMCLYLTLVLAFPASLGASAGRMLLQ